MLFLPELALIRLHCKLSGDAEELLNAGILPAMTEIPRNFASPVDNSVGKWRIVPGAVPGEDREKLFQIVMNSVINI